MARHGLAALIVLALVSPLLPERSGMMVCCSGTDEACACPIGLGFSRCEAAPPLTPAQPPAVLPPVQAFADCPETDRIAPPSADNVTAVLLERPEPVPRA